MSITYPISLPSSPGPSGLSWANSAVNASVVSPFTRTPQIQAHMGQIWAVRVKYPPMSSDMAADWEATLLALNGILGTFLWGDSARKVPRGVATGTPLVKGANQSGQELITDGWTPGVTGILKASDWIQVGSGLTQRAHKVLKNANSDGSGNATFDIWPRLRESPADNAPLTLTNTKMCMRLADNMMDYEVSVAKHYGFELDMVEALGTSIAVEGGGSGGTTGDSATGLDSITFGDFEITITHNLGTVSAFIQYANPNWNGGGWQEISKDGDTITIRFQNACSLMAGGELNWRVST